MPKRRISKKQILIICFLAGLLLAAVYTIHLDSIVRERFEGKRFSLPAKVYSSPLELYPGLSLSPDEMAKELALLRYRKTPRAKKTGTYRWQGRTLEMVTRPFVFTDGSQKAVSLGVEFRGEKVEKILDRATGKTLSIARLDPPLIGGIYPKKKEDRILVRLTDSPKHLVNALIAVEDNRFFSHHGIDPKGIGRAILVTASGDEVQGGSTLTQQLAKNFFLTPERTLKRKITEMLMALLMELHYSKQEILETYINEVYLGQEGDRAIHGFGLAASFYFDKPLSQLNIPEAALLVGMLKGPTFYNPRRHPEKALARRNLALEEMARKGFITSKQLGLAKAAPLGVVKNPPRGDSPYPAFLDLVYRQLKQEYRDEDLRSEGLRILTTINPRVQRSAERALSNRLARLEKARKLKRGNLQGALLVTSTQDAEVQALIGGRNPRFEGFNRAIDMRRPIGSLIKPAVYLTALLNPQKYTLATLLDDSPFILRQKGSKAWSPKNYDKRFHGKVSLRNSLVNSYNVPTVRLGLEVGVSQVMDTLRRLGIERDLPEFSSSLLGVNALSPLEVTQVYQTIAGGGFGTPLKTIRAVMTNQGELVKRYPLKVEQKIDEAPIYLLTNAMQGVVQKGTAHNLSDYLPSSLDIAGKTGTTDRLRDSWFAGFSGDRLAVVWVGSDDNKPTGLTGSSGAMVIWGEMMASLNPMPLTLTQPDNIEWVWIDPKSGLRSKRECPGSMEIPFITGSAPTKYAKCGSGSLGESLEAFFERIFNQ
ncbi:penicillin-binding protein 1B [Dethiosulfatarculus sandiegensis]|uniref:Penicillin-binding protein 1B n=1 Tax=Dethiosulfatarculus sandiegensis TaxID=1429043 RepID=A0A0D2GLI7_9BACT|nr:penicillin-binding protein 1B [Dethiosulfatarculus sandiegensis]KIX15502.1 penicillin-binding protein 1B [Dethiosulfatarculus sandiegensis]